VISASTAACTPTSAGNIRISPSGNDATCARGDASRPCASFNRAYQVAQPGDLVSVDSGSYPAQRIAYDATKSSDPVTFAPSDGASVFLDRLDIGQPQLDIRAPQHIVVSDMNIDYTEVWDGAEDIALKNLQGRSFDVLYGGGSSPPSNVRILGGDFGSCEMIADAKECVNYVSGQNVVIDGARLHDITSNDLVTAHVDGIFVRGCQGCAIRSSTFSGNDVTNIRIQNCCDLPQNTNLTIESNSFGQPNDGRADGVDIDTATPGLVIRGNVFDPSSGPWFSRSGYNGERLVQNKMQYVTACVPGVSYESNMVRPNFNANTLCGTDFWGNWSL
jgi:hypothetical protein